LTNAQTVVTVLLSILFLTGCGGSGGGSGSSASTKAQGVYFGTTSLGTTFETIVLPTDSVRLMGRLLWYQCDGMACIGDVSWSGGTIPGLIYFRECR
jgi:hypothetical protein